MKIKSLILAMAACAGLFTACTDELDNGSTTNPDETAGNAYMTVTFSTPAGTGTRAAAGPAGDGSQDAVMGEYEVDNANFFLFGEDNLLKLVVAKPAGTIKDGPATGNVQKTWTTSFALQPAKYQVYVVVNEDENNKLTTLAAGTSLATFQEKVFKAAITTANYCRPGKFLMTNAFTVTGSEGVVEVFASNDQTNPAKVTVNVERAAAKIAFEIPANGKSDVKNSDNVTIATIDFKSYKIINTRNGAFFQRRVTTGIADFKNWTIGGAETATDATHATNYVLDNFFEQKSNFFSGSGETVTPTADYTANYSRKYDTYVAWRKLDVKAEKNSQDLAYCLENTMKQSDDIAGLVTTVIFRAVYTPEAGYIKGTKPEGWDGTFYRYPKGSNSSILYYTLQDLIKGVYTSLANAKAEGRFGLTDIDVTNETELNAHLATLAADQDALFKTYSTEQYPQGYCYYTYYIRHADNGDKEVRGVMEHVIVRNNVYALSIKSVSSLGSISSGTPGPGTEDMVPDPSNPEGPKVPGPGVDEPETGTNPEIPGTVDPSGPVEPVTPIIPIKPTDPTENKTTYLEVTVNVLKWIKRNNEIEL